MRKREHVARQPMPLQRAIHWRPLRDPHYVLAALRRDYDGPGDIFIQQRVLARIEGLARAAQHRDVLGLLVGRRYQCSSTGARYTVIEAMSEHAEPVTHEDFIATAIANELVRLRLPATQHVVGWYSSTAALTGQPPAHVAAVHAAHFNAASQVALVVANASSPPAGALFAYDRSGARYFHVPFYELTAAATASGQPKPTCISWPQYMTSEPVASVAIAGATDNTSSISIANRSTTPRRSIWGSLRSLTNAGNSHGNGRSMSSPSQAANGANGTADTVGRDTGGSRNGDGRHLGTPGRNAKPNRKADPAVFARKPSVEAGREDRNPASPDVRRVSDSEDTAVGDTLDRFLELAQSEGFFIAARFDSETDAGANTNETLWVLNEPFSGLLLTVVGCQAEVLDATLHYNLHAADAELLQRTFPEHRDLDTQTIYERESCVQALRARCWRLRATNALQRTWLVPASIYFLTPAEWQSVTDRYGDPRAGAEAIQVLNAGRVGLLPSAVQSQFCLVGRQADAT